MLFKGPLILLWVTGIFASQVAALPESVSEQPQQLTHEQMQKMYLADQAKQALNPEQRNEENKDQENNTLIAKGSTDTFNLIPIINVNVFHIFRLI